MRKIFSVITYFCLILCFNASIFAGPTSSSKNDVTSKNAALKKNSYTLALYINPRCPYCQKVTSYLAQQGRTVPIKNTQDPGVREELVKIGGKSQVPCLVINGNAMYESDAIIDWLKNHP